MLQHLATIEPIVMVITHTMSGQTVTEWATVYTIAQVKVNVG